MASEAVQRVLAALPDAKRNGDGWYARCPAHDDRQPSLSIAEGDDGRALVNCHASCTAEAVVKAMGLTMAALMGAVSEAANGNENGQRPVRPSSSAPTKQPTVFASASDAISALEKRHGRHLNLWTYHDADGNPVGVVIRWNKANRKDIRPVSLDPEQGGWIIGGMPKPRPLYGLPGLAKALRIYVCEGEKAADAARVLGLTATTSPHGSKSAAKADWFPLSQSPALPGREIVILPDADVAGDHYADDVVDQLAKLSHPPEIKVVRLPGLPFGDGGDMADFVELRGGDVVAIKREVEALADNAQPLHLNTPGILKTMKLPSKRIAPFRAFPVETLPEPVVSFVSETAQAIGCDPSFIALPLLVGLASAIGNSRCIQLKRGWTEPAILWGAIIGESGTTKSPALELALRAVRRRQKRKLRDHREAIARWKPEFERYEEARNAWKQKIAKNPTTAGDRPEAPEAPRWERCWTDDATIEALAKLLQENPRGLLMIRDELAAWLNFDRYSASGSGSNGRGSEASKWLEMFGGRALVVDRKTSGTICVPQATVSIIGGIQPGVLSRYVVQEHRDSGLLARLLLTMPPRRAKRWTEADVDPIAEAGIAKIFDVLFALEPTRDAEGECQPAIVKLTPEGKRAWISFYDEHNQEQADLTGDLAAAWSKLEGYAARFALVHHLIRGATGEDVGSGVDAASVGAGVRLSRWFAYEVRRVYAMLGEDEESRESRQLVEMIERKGGEVGVRDWQRARSHRTAKDAVAELESLVAAGLGRWGEPGPGPKGGRPTKRFILAERMLQPSQLPVSNAEKITIRTEPTSPGSKEARRNGVGCLHGGGGHRA